MYTNVTKRYHNGLRVSENTSLLVTKSKKPHNIIGNQLILSAIEKVLKTFLHKPADSL